MNEDYKLIAIIVLSVLLFFIALIVGDTYKETHTPKYYIDFQDKRYELKEVK